MEHGTAISYNLEEHHELGHYFNLFHLWGDNYCGDDWVNDTPTQEEANFGCKTIQVLVVIIMGICL